ncbi:MAG: HAD family phosphatase [Eubacterium sp.]|nr:HAD family phosphatase [Eubacterium sp.]
MIKTEAVIFDMDGVIFDSERIYLECCIAVGKKYAMNNVEEVCHRCIGTNSAMTRQILLDSCGEDFPVEEFTRDTSGLFWERYHAEGQLPVKTGTEELLQYLTEKGIPAAIASSTKTEVVRRQLKDAGLLDYFSRVVGGDQVTRSKPEPDIFLKAAEVMQTAPENCLVIEDSYNGIRAAAAAGMTSIMVPDLLEPNDEMREKAWKILPSLTEVKELLG